MLSRECKSKCDANFCVSNSENESNLCTINKMPTKPDHQSGELRRSRSAVSTIKWLGMGVVQWMSTQAVIAKPNVMLPSQYERSPSTLQPPPISEPPQCPKSCFQSRMHQQALSRPLEGSTCKSQPKLLVNSFSQKRQRSGCYAYVVVTTHKKQRDSAIIHSLFFASSLV